MADDGCENVADYNINYKSITCERIPELFLDRLVAKNHFSRFGKINRFILRPNRLCCTVEYETEKDASNAYEKAGCYNGNDFIVNFTVKEIGHVQNTEEWVDPDVQSELDAMSAAEPRLRQSLTKAPPVLPRLAKSSVAPKQTKSASASSLPAAEQSALPKVDAAVRMELEAVLRRPANTDEERYRVLDARDKLMRLTAVRQTDIKKAVSTKGTCPDMCPEKERLMREFQRQVCSFEMSDGTLSANIDHRRAIKEYSRSSADQEVPLAHELRSESVLQMTMLYLMHNILDLCDDPQTSIADWFHFVWDRTRSIRKDITQQELCSLGAVQLVEQCARFHIHCAARLVAEDPSVFDKKINAENLTKCLQTLKYMYHDLRIKNVRCPCEAEFRGYIVLLNLGDANFLWELKQLPEEIQNSAEIKRGIAFYNALQNNNYVRFFNLIRGPNTSYLSACILLGYFTKLRLKAMEAIVKAYTWRKHPSWLPLSYLRQMLGFETEAAAVDFFGAHGLHCEDGRVKLARLHRTDMEYCMDRSLLLVESKRSISVGECVCGQSLSSSALLQNHKPHNSFGSNGLLKPEAWRAEDQLRGSDASAVARRVTAEQRQTSISAAALPSLASATEQQKQVTVGRCDSESNNLFKVPLTTPSLSPKQLLQKQQQQQQQQQHSRSQASSIFGGNVFSSSKIATTAAQTSLGGGFGGSSSNFLASPKPNTEVSHIFGQAATTNGDATDSGASLFKMPLCGAAATRTTTTTAAPQSIFSRAAAFTSDVRKSSQQSIFESFGKKAAAAATPSIEGNIFQQRQQPQSSNSAPQPLVTDNIFKHFQTTAPIFAAPPATTTTHSSSIFGAAAEATATATTTNTFAKQSTSVASEMLQRKQQLEAEQRQKLAQLEEERHKLKILEEKQARMREEAQRKSRLDALHLKAEQQTELLLEALFENLLLEIASTELDKYRLLEQRTQQLMAEVLLECVQEQTQQILSEEYAVMCRDQLLLQRYFERWLQTTRRKMQQRRLLQDTPLWVGSETREQWSQQLQHPRQHENLQHIKRYRAGEPCNFQRLLTRARRGASEDRKQRSIDVCEIIATQLRDSETRSRHYFKLLLTLPGEQEELPGFESLCSRWLREYVRQPQQQSERGSDSNSDCYICAATHNVALCVRKLCGIAATNEAGDVVRCGESDNADAIVCFLTGDNLDNTSRRLRHLFAASKLYKAMPVALLVYNACGADEQTLASRLQLDDLVSNGKVSRYASFGLHQTKASFDFCSNFKHALSFVTRESLNSSAAAASESLEMQTLSIWLESALGEIMWQRWMEASIQNPVFSKICTLPHLVVALYNEAVQRLHEIAAADMSDAPEFAEELRSFVPPSPTPPPHMPQRLPHFPPDWKNPQRRQIMSRFLSDIQLPPLTKQQLLLNAGSIGNAAVEDVELALLNYAGECASTDDELGDDDMTLKVAYKSIEALIAALNSAHLRTLELPQRLNAICWLPVLKPLAFLRINQRLRNAEALPKEVIYRSEAFSDYQELPWWLNFQPLNAVTVDYTDAEADAESDAALAESEENELTTTALSIAAIIEQGEAAAERAEQNLLQLKQKTLDDDLTRALDEGLYQFDLARKCGTFVTTLSSEEEEEEKEEEDNTEMPAAKAFTSSPRPKKRKHEEPLSEMEAIMAKAFALIEEVETKQDRMRFMRYAP